MKLLKNIFFHLLIFIILGLIYFAFVVLINFKLGFYSFIYYIIIYIIVLITYFYVNKKTKFLTKKRNKFILILTTIVASSIVIGILTGTSDYLLIKNGKTPKFSNQAYSFTQFYDYSEDDPDSKYSGIRCEHTEYFGLGYKIVICNACLKPFYFMPFRIGTYAWFVENGEHIDKLNGRWFHANNNDIYINFDGIDNYSLSEYNKITAEGIYTINDDDKVIIKPSDNSKIGNCIIKNDYHELHCDVYANVFMK